ncbi:hypothetical protein ACP4OV_005620 [Aristida adscensionis]
MESAAPVLVRHAGGVAALRQLPPGFRFRPTDEELVVQYLRRKAFGAPLPAAVIPVVPDLFALDPWDIPGATEGEKYFFAVRPAAGGGGGKKQQGAGRCAAATASGRWKAAGKERPVALPRPCGGSLLVGVKRAMAFAPRAKKKAAAPAAAAVTTGWVMHEYRLAAPLHNKGCSLGEAQGEWVVCRVFQKSCRPARRRAPSPAMSPAVSSSSAAPSSASCVTDGSDQEEVSS